MSKAECRGENSQSSAFRCLLELLAATLLKGSKYAVNMADTCQKWHYGRAVEKTISLKNIYDPKPVAKAPVKIRPPPPRAPKTKPQAAKPEPTIEPPAKPIMRRRAKSLSFVPSDRTSHKSSQFVLPMWGTPEVGITLRRVSPPSHAAPQATLPSLGQIVVVLLLSPSVCPVLPGLKHTTYLRTQTSIDNNKHFIESFKVAYTLLGFHALQQFMCEVAA
ncbi:hypothetical protein NQD34_003258 [Periophthalmus magnuspinnatus]|nr:hypothetical protein NQD34_003258 [Periophthalmus magnuspinnatus]